MDNGSEGSFAGALGWALVQSGGSRAIGLGVSFVLAAVVGPEAYGVVALAVAYLSFLQIFVLEGMSAAVVQRKQLLDDHKHAVFWLNLGASIGLGCLGMALSGLWARANHTPGLGEVVVVLSLILPIDGVSVVHRGLLQRRMNFKQLALRDGVSVLAGGVIGVTGALIGWGVWALVAQRLVASSAGSVVLWWSVDWRPKARFAWGPAREMLGFASGIYAASVGRYLSNYLDTLMLGLFFGPAMVGLYHLANTFRVVVGTVTNQAVASVSLPHLSRSQDDGVELRRRFLHSLRASVLLAVPVLAGTALCSHLIMSLIGPRWEAGAPAMRILCVLGMMIACVQMRGPLLLAMGRPHLLVVIVWAQGVVVGLSLVVAGRLLADSPAVYATTAVAWIRLSVFAAVVLPATYWIARRAAGITVGQLAKPLLPGLLSGVAVVSIGGVVLRLLGLGSSAISQGVSRAEVVSGLVVVGLALLPVYAYTAISSFRGRRTG